MDLRWVISKIGYCPPDNLRWVISKASTRLNIPIYPYKHWVYGLALGYFQELMFCVGLFPRIDVLRWAISKIALGYFQELVFCVGLFPRLRWDIYRKSSLARLL
jgi:hypothetical protein